MPSVPPIRTVEHRNLLPNVRSVIAVASCKGGVGKSTVSANLAVALAGTGAAVGLLDADIYGPSIHIMMGVNTPPPMANGKIVPTDRHGIRFMSIGLIANEQTPVVWRGPLVGQMIQKFMVEVAWGELDFLVIDMPPGTGDASLTLVQSASVSGAIIVTTPQDVALEDVRRGVEMFRKLNVPVLGVVENMSYFSCPCCGERTEVFGRGGGEDISGRFNIPLLGRLPINPAIREGGDAGRPIVVSVPDSEEAETFRRMAKGIRDQVMAKK
ncbi:MAG: ATP-binding protein [Candidatus Latescibacteria bacterium]|nr:ATP-binding protein [Candidatus Latescibacterota bacterium]